MNIKKLEGVEVFLWYMCNLDCEFCFQRDLRKNFFKWKEFDTDYVKFFLEKARKENKEFVIFSGWEPTLRTDLSELVDFARKIGYKEIKVHSNWYKISEEDYLRDLYNKWLTGLIISVHGIWKNQDLISKRKWNFIFLNKALINVKKLIKEDPSFTLDTNTVICSKNISSFLHIFLYLFKFHIQRSQIAYPVSLFNFSLKEKKKILLPYKMIIPIVEKVLILSKKFGRKIVIQGFPYCVVPPSLWPFCEHDDNTDMESLSLVNYTLTRDATYDNIKLEKCKLCKFYNKCKGIPKDYYEFFWDNDIIPIVE